MHRFTSVFHLQADEGSEIEIHTADGDDCWDHVSIRTVHSETRSVARGTCYAVQLQAEMSEVHATRRIPRVDAALAMAYVHFHLKNRSCVI